jgi:hypothetical protein
MPRLVLSTPALRDLAAIEERIEEASGSSEAVTFPISSDQS